jgi:hypothetical protein
MYVAPEATTVAQIAHHVVEAVRAKDDNQQHQEFLGYGVVHAA